VTSKRRKRHNVFVKSYAMAECDVKTGVGGSGRKGAASDGCSLLSRRSSSKLHQKIGRTDDLAPKEKNLMAPSASISEVVPLSLDSLARQIRSKVL
jgi:hypothetical protein